MTSPSAMVRVTNNGALMAGELSETDIMTIEYDNRPACDSCQMQSRLAGRSRRNRENIRVDAATNAADSTLPNKPQSGADVVGGGVLPEPLPTTKLAPALLRKVGLLTSE